MLVTLETGSLIGLKPQLISTEHYVRSILLSVLLSPQVEEHHILL